MVTVSLALSAPISATLTAIRSSTVTPASEISNEADSDARAARVRQIASDLLDVAQLPSLSVALLDGKRIDAEAPTLRFALGHENIERGQPATPLTTYRAASVSKLFTATALARLVDAGQVTWDTPVADLVPSFPNLEGATLRQLAGHLSGIAHYRAEDRIERFEATPNVRDALAFFRDSPRIGAPGEQMHYTTHGYTLLSAALEAAKETSFLELIKTEITGPLKLERTGPAWLPHEREELERSTAGSQGHLPDSPQHAQLYMITPGGPQAFPQVESATYKWGGGGLATTPTDLVQLARAYLRAPDMPTPFLAPETVEAMWTSQEVDGKPTGTGIGWRVGQDELGRPVRHHAGSMQGARSVLMIDPARRDAIAVMTNASWNSAIETTALLLLDAWRLEAPTTNFEGTVAAQVWIEPKDSEPGERASGPATWRDGALDLPAPDDLKRRVRSWNTNVRIRPVAAHLEGGGRPDRWAAITARGAGPGTCTQAETSAATSGTKAEKQHGTWSCRFRLTHDADLRVEWRNEPTSANP